MKNFKYGEQIIINGGLFDNCNGIFFSTLPNNKCKIEVFFEIPIEWKKGEDYHYFKDVTKRKMTSAMIIISKENII